MKKVTYGDVKVMDLISTDLGYRQIEKVEREPSLIGTGDVIRLWYRLNERSNKADCCQHGPADHPVDLVMLPPCPSDIDQDLEF